MIQRIQSVYLFFGALLLALFVAFSDAWTGLVSDVHALYPWWVYVLSALGGLSGFAAVFLYKDRKVQSRFIVVAQWLDLALIFLIVAALGMLSFGDEVLLQSSVMTYTVFLMPVAAYILFSLARRAVKKDIDLVRSMDRLR